MDFSVSWISRQGRQHRDLPSVFLASEALVVPLALHPTCSHLLISREAALAIETSTAPTLTVVTSPVLAAPSVRALLESPRLVLLVSELAGLR